MVIIWWGLVSLMFLSMLVMFIGMANVKLRHHKIKKIDHTKINPYYWFNIK